MFGPSVKELLESLGTGKATHSTSQPDTGIQSNQLSSSSYDGVAALSGGAEAGSLEASSHPAVAQISQLDPPCPESTAGSLSPLSPPLSNGLCDSEEQLSSPPSQPRAASLVPQPQKTDAVTVAQSVLVDQPQPLLSPRHRPLSPAPSPTPACVDEVIKPKVSSCALPAIKPTLVSVPEPMATKTPSTQQAGSLSLPVPVPVQKTDCCDPQMCGLSLDGLAAHPPSTSEFTSYPSAIPQDNQVLFGHSADHINFFSAREKFKGMTQDGKTQCAAGQQLPQLKSCGKEQQPLPQEVSASEGKEEEKTKVRMKQNSD